MSVVVQKYGGSSVSDAEAIKRVARRIVDTHKAGNAVCVVTEGEADRAAFGRVVEDGRGAVGVDVADRLRRQAGIG